MQQSTRDALISSEPHAQKPPDVSKSYVQNISAFFSEDYFNPKSSMNSDDSLDTYYAADDDTIRGSGYKKRPPTSLVCTACLLGLTLGCQQDQDCSPTSPGRHIVIKFI